MRRDNLRRLHPEWLERNDAVYYHAATMELLQLYAETLDRLLRQAEG